MVETIRLVSPYYGHMSVCLRILPPYFNSCPANSSHRGHNHNVDKHCSRFSWPSCHSNLLGHLGSRSISRSCILVRLQYLDWQFKNVTNMTTALHFGMPGMKYVSDKHYSSVQQVWRRSSHYSYFLDHNGTF